jgi:hypothetical protein
MPLRPQRTAAEAVQRIVSEQLDREAREAWVRCCPLHIDLAVAAAHLVELACALGSPVYVSNAARAFVSLGFGLGEPVAMEITADPRGGLFDEAPEAVYAALKAWVGSRPVAHNDDGGPYPIAQERSEMVLCSCGGYHEVMADGCCVPRYLRPEDDLTPTAFPHDKPRARLPPGASGPKCRATAALCHRTKLEAPKSRPSPRV